MSLNAKLAAFDDAALEALASKGVVRRARRDLDAGRATIVEQGAADAKVDADGQIVAIDERGPAAARCSCPATGVCRHIVLAVIALRGDESAAARDERTADAPAPQADADSKPVGERIVDELCALSQAELEKFAGADWTDALELAADEASFELTEGGTSCVVALRKPQCTVTFVAGQGLRGAIFKGPKTRRRAVIAACALRLRSRANVHVDSTPGAAGRAHGADVSAEFLAAVRIAIEQGVAAVLPGRSTTAADRFLDLAVSTRAESLPRLAAELRRLARHASRAAAHDAAFDTEAFLIDAARTHALAEALRSAPQDTRLTGLARRDYRAAEPLALWMLGAARWRSDAGARGVTAYGFSPSTRRWHAAHQGRTAGTDPSFEPAAVYRSPLWGAGVLEALIGRTLELPEPWIAEDGAIAPTLSRPARADSPLPAWERLIESGAAHDDFTALRLDLAARIGLGLRRSAMPSPAVIVPASFGRCTFSELDQAYEWEVIDSRGNRLVLELRVDDERVAEQLPALARRIRAILVEAVLGSRGLSITPVTLFIDEGREARIVNLGFDELPRADAVGKALERVRNVFAPHIANVRTARHDPIDAVVSAVLDVAAARVEHSAHPDLAKIAETCEACGLMTLAVAVRRMGETNDVVSALAASYAAGETRAALRLHG